MTTQTLMSCFDDLISEIKGEDFNESEFLSCNQAAKVLGVHINTVYKIIATGQLPVYDLALREGQKTYYRIHKSDLCNWLEGRRRSC